MTDSLSESGLLGEQELTQFVRRGHFVYESGDHGDTWLQLELLFHQPARLRVAARTLAEQLGAHDVDLVCGPVLGGALLGPPLAEEMGLDFVYAERKTDSLGRVRYALPAALRARAANRRALVVDDAINAGSATKACIDELVAAHGKVVAIGALIVRSAALPSLREKLARPIEALLTLDWNLWPASSCPLCASGRKIDA